MRSPTRLPAVPVANDDSHGSGPPEDRLTASDPRARLGARRDKKKRWTEPRLTELPGLTDLTLQTGGPIPGGGGTGGGGSTVF